jgi:O-Antigen ligase
MFFVKCFDIRRIIFSLTIFGYGLFAFAVTDQNTQAVTIPYRVLVLVINIALFLRDFKILNSVKKKQAVNVSPNLTKAISTLVYLFIFTYSCRLIHSVYISNNLLLFPDKFQYILYWFFIFLVPGINFLFVDTFRSDKYFYATWIVLALIGFSSLFLDVNSASNQFSSMGRLALAAVNPIMLGHYGTSLFLLSLYEMLNNKQHRELHPKAGSNTIFLLTSIVGLVVALMASSRGPLLAMIICTVVMVITSQRKNGLNVKFLSSLIALLLCFALVASFSLKEDNQILDRIYSASDEVDSSDSRSRGYLYETAVKTFLEYPLTGFGIELPNGEGYPHNLILESFLSLGICGGIVFIIITTFATISSIKLLLSKNSCWGWIGILFIQYFIAGFSSGSLYGANIFWYLLLAIIGICRGDVSKEDLNYKT